MKLRFSLLMLAAVLIAGCTARDYVEPDFVASSSGVQGHLLRSIHAAKGIRAAGPASAVVYAATADRSNIVASRQTDSQGNFSLPLRAGEYFIYTQGDYGQYGRRVRVSPGHFTPITLMLPPQA